MSDLTDALGGLTNAGQSLSDAVVNIAAQGRVAFDAANGLWKPVGGGVAPNGFSAPGSVVTGGVPTSLLDKVKPYIVPGLLLLVVAGIGWAIFRRKKGA